MRPSTIRRETPSSPKSTRRGWRGLVVAATAAVLAATVPAPAQADNPVTPGNFTGYALDQCVAPTQGAMDAWLNNSVFFGVGIYISGDSRACTYQPNLTPTWVAKQLNAGWRLLPITLGPQASCTTRERYLRQVRINPSSADGYLAARLQGQKEADKAIAAAKALGIPVGSTLFYDIEAWDTRKSADCNRSAMFFLTSWTKRLKDLHWVSGIYSSAASGMKLIDDARVTPNDGYWDPDRIWVADWNGKPDLYSTFIRSDGWMPHSRVHQYRGGHNETWGGVTINIDSNFMSQGTGSASPAEPVHCGGVNLDFPTYGSLAPGAWNVDQIKALQCRLKEKGFFPGVINGKYDQATTNAVRAYQTRRGLPVGNGWSHQAWVSLLVDDDTSKTQKYGSATVAVRRVQRALNAAASYKLAVNGVMSWASVNAVKDYQRRVGLSQTGVVNPATWAKLVKGAY